MTTKAEISAANELQFELKYCERCGGLWLRPVGGGQIYCVPCGQAMAELPAAAGQREGVANPRLPQGPQWDWDEGGVESFEQHDGLDLDAVGGVA